MKKLFLFFSFLIISVVSISFAIDKFDSRPSYVRASHKRLNSYLASNYGEMDCVAKMYATQDWALICKSSGFNKKTFIFKTYLAEEQYEYKDAFYLTAENEAAKQSAKLGLMAYLDIR